jgi:hypothetical protein
VQFVGAVTADHVKPIAVEELAVALRFVGAAGTALQAAACVVALTGPAAADVPALLVAFTVKL